MNRRMGIGILAVLTGVGIVTRVLSQDRPAEPPKPGQPAMPDMAEMIKQMKALARPGPEHKLLDNLVGDWNTKMKMWMGGPATPASENEGHSKVKWVLGDRFIQEEFDGDMSMPDEKGAMKPMKFHGIGMTGYDNYRKMYVGSWADTMGTQLLSMRGWADQAGKTITTYGEMDEPSMHMYGKLVKYVTRMVDKDKHVFEIYDLA